MYRRILVPLDGSDLAEQALPHALTLAQAFQSHVILLRVLEPLPGVILLPKAIITEAEAMTRELAHNYLEEVATRLSQHGISVEVATTEGHPAEEIVLFSETANVDLVVMCTHGHSGARPYHMGTVAERVLHGATVAVLVARAGQKYD